MSDTENKHFLRSSSSSDEDNVPSSTSISSDDVESDNEASESSFDSSQDTSDEEYVVNFTAEQIKANIRRKVILTLIKDYKKESNRCGDKFDLNKYLDNIVKKSSKIDDPTSKDDPLLQLMANSISEQLVINKLTNKLKAKIREEGADINVVDFYKSQLCDDYEEDDGADYEADDEADDEEDDEAEGTRKFIFMFGNEKNTPTRLDKSKYDDKDQEYVDLIKKEKSKYTSDANLNYFSKLKEKDKEDMLHLLKKIQDTDQTLKPLFFKIMDSTMDLTTKAYSFKKLNELEDLNPHTDDYYKTKMLLEALVKIPFGKYKTIEKINPTKTRKVKKFMKRVDKKMNTHVYGHEKTKERIKQIMAKWITNPDSRGNVIGLCGPPGTGKTELLRTLGEKVLDRPFHLVSLGGAHDSSYLEGFEYTYVGSKWGRVVECLLKSDCMNPVFFFDELDKVSNNHRGDEIMNFLIHLTDPVQNDKYHDKYFGNLDLDLSKALFVFSFNHASKVDRILRDRMEIIKVEGYPINDKIHIVKSYLLPKICKDVGFLYENLVVSEEIIKYIIAGYTFEGGVRRIKEHFTNIVMALNKRSISEKMKLPYVLTKDDVDKVFLKDKRPFTQKRIGNKPMVGVVNELCAITIAGCSTGLGEMTPTVTTYAPSKDKYELIMTGNLGKMSKEVLIVAKSLLWNLIPYDKHEKLFKKWRDSAIHYHAPNIAMSKDGPSAGVANIVAMVSLVTGIPIKNNIALTGEVSVDGKVTEIGGLKEKANGAKAAGCRLVLCPEENRHDYMEIVNDKYTPIDNTFNIQCIPTVWEALDIMLVDNDFEFNKFGAALTADEQPAPKKRVKLS